MSDPNPLANEAAGVTIDGSTGSVAISPTNLAKLSQLEADAWANQINEAQAADFLEKYSRWLQAGGSNPLTKPQPAAKVAGRFDGTGIVYSVLAGQYVASYPAPSAALAAEYGGPIGVKSPISDAQGGEYYSTSMTQYVDQANLNQRVTVTGPDGQPHKFMLVAIPGFLGHLWLKLT